MLHLINLSGSHTLGRTPRTRDQPDAKTYIWQLTIFKRDRHPWPWRDSNEQSQQANGHRTTSYATRPRELASKYNNE